MTNGRSHDYHSEGPTFIIRGIGSDFSFLFHFSMKFLQANRIASDGTPRFVASHLVLVCLPIFHKKNARLIWVNNSYIIWMVQGVPQLNNAAFPKAPKGRGTPSNRNNKNTSNR